MSKKIAYTLLSTAIALPILSSPTLSAGKYGLEDTAKRSGLSQYGSDLPTLTGAIIGTALSVIGVVFFILMIYGGFLWMTARGKEEYVTKAKDTIIAAIVGLILVLGAYAITSFVFNAVGGGGGTTGGNGPAATAGNQAAADEQGAAICANNLSQANCEANAACQKINRGQVYQHCTSLAKYNPCNTTANTCVRACAGEAVCRQACYDTFYACVL